MTPEWWSQAERLYHDAVGRGASQRAAFLTEACQGDEVLRQEVESLLAHDGEAAFLSTPVIAQGGGTTLVGQRLGPYVIAARIGEGAMGEVYRARDSKLQRDVAIKVLPPVFRSDRERLARFEREARILAALNHPHIAAIHGLEDFDGHPALVLELLDGETLADRLARSSNRRSLRVKETLAIARQIAEALDGAHGRGIIHRDLKPANIMITRDGTVKVLDFGLAKLVPDTSGDAACAAPASDGTHEGVVLGTAAYMSPEQARGQAVDKRTDIWAFGCVLYEMLTGRAAFEGQTVSDTIAAVLKNEPLWAALPDETPFMARRVLRLCLEKDPRRRLRDIGDIHLTEETKSEAAVASAPRPPVLWTLAVAGLTVITAIALAGWWRATKPSVQPTVRLALDLAQGEALAASTSPAVLSPDGTRIVYQGRSGQLFVRAIDAHHSTRLPGTENARHWFFSPEGQAVGFFANGKLKRIDLESGRSIDLCDARDPRGASWGADDNIVAALDFRTPLVRIPATGGTPQDVTLLQEAVTHRWPQVLPGAQAVVFTANKFVGDFDHATVEIQSLKTGKRNILVRGGYYGRYAASGHLLYVRNATVYARHLDVERQQLDGPELAAITNVTSRASAGYAFFDLSLNGTLMYAEGEQATQRLTWLDRTGRSEPLGGRAALYSQFPLRFSPDGTRLALASIDRTNRDVWLYELARDAWTRLTTSGDTDDLPVWSPDGHHIAYVSGMGRSGTGMFWKRADGTGEAVRLFSSENVNHPFSFSPDGKYLAYSEMDPQTKTDLWILSIENARRDDPKVTERTAFLRTEFNEDAPAISPDGRWLAYQSDESGRSEVYVRPFPASTGKWAVSTKGGSSPVWSKMAPELFYVTSEGIEAVRYRVTGGIFEPGPPKLSVARKGISAAFDVSPLSNRFVIVDGASDESPSPRFTLVLNFFDELRHKVPAN